ncbi:MAG TPA: uroporphyrinogen-III C-methyltransferase [Candidatus Sulfotelmatobacter sp.]|nr:uroporphyrinogen-III C-methyltransferase [Candidatus Sulfotelmatobacter sp.]
MNGKLYMVGAGPGAADLLTVRAASLLRKAEVVLHDDLVPQEILDLCPPSAQIVNVGKRCGRHGSSQEQINALLVWYARETQSKVVVRLKSGDPAVFGRLGEELEALRRADVPFEIVPGITAAAAAAAAASVTLTDRRTASALVLVTAHTANNGPLPRTIFDPARSTYAIYMPGPDYARTARDLMESGLDPAVPCAVISNAGRTNQEARFLTLEQLATQRNIPAPALLIVGEVARTGLEASEKQFPICLSDLLSESPGVTSDAPSFYSNRADLG